MNSNQFIIALVAVSSAIGLRFLLFSLFMVLAQSGHDEYEATQIVLIPGYVYQELGLVAIIMAHTFAILIPIILLGTFFFLWGESRKDNKFDKSIAE